MHKIVYCIRPVVQACARRNSTVNINQSKIRRLLTLNDIPQPRGLPFLGTKLDYLISGRGKKLHDYINKRHQDLGPFFCEEMGHIKIIFTSSPFHMKSLFLNLEGKYPMHILPEPWVFYEELYGSKRGLFFMNGDEWLQNRRILNKFILRDNDVNSLQIPIADTISKFVENWRINASESPNLEAELYKLSIDVVVSVLLGPNCIIEPSRHHEELITMFSATVKEIFQTTTKLSGMPIKLCYNLNLKVWRDFKESIDKSLYLANKLVTEMLRSIAPTSNSGLIKKLIDEKLPEETIIRIIADFVIAAGDTTSFTTLWTLFLLGKDKRVISDLRLNNLDVKHVIKESMRLYPVAPFLTRILPKDCELDSYHLQAGTPVVASIYTSGRDEKYFSHANKFIPQRWDRNSPRKAELPNHEPSATLPFSMGARSCIGKKIALIQLTEIIKQIVENFDIELYGNKNIEPITLQVLVPNKPIQLKITPRKK